jgi:N4-gp56 family major capsid protein
MPSAITGTTGLAASPTAYSGSNTQLTHAIQTIWSKEILFQAMPILRMEQFAVKKTELGVSPGLQVNFMRYYNLQPPLGPLTEGIRMETNALTSEQIVITVAEQGYAVAVSELLLNSSFDDIMATTSRRLGRNMATFLDNQCYATLSLGTSQLFGYDRSAFAGATTTNVYGAGTVGTTYAGAAATSITGTGGTGAIFLTTASIKDAVETLASKNIPRIGETYVNFLHPHQSRC